MDPRKISHDSSNLHQLSAPEKELKKKKNQKKKYGIMPLPSDEQILQTSRDLITQLQSLSGKHPGCRPGSPPIICAHSTLIDKHYNSSCSRLDA